MNIFNYKRRKLFSGPHFIGLLLVIAGVIALLSPIFFNIENYADRALGVGIGTVLLGLFIITSYSGTMIDFAGKRFKEYTAIAGFKYGNWKNLPPIKVVKVISNSYLRSNIPNGISPTLSLKVTDFKVVFYSNTSKLMFSFVYSNQDKAIKTAKHFTAKLTADLVLEV